MAKRTKKERCQNCWRKFRLLMWKDVKLNFSEVSSIIYNFAIPIAVLFILFIMRISHKRLYVAHPTYYKTYNDIKGHPTVLM